MDERHPSGLFRTGGRNQATLAGRVSVERESLRLRVFVTLLVAGGLLVPVLLGAMWGAMLSFEDAFLRRQIETEVDRLLAARVAGEEATPAPRFEAFWDGAELPEPYRAWQGDLFAGGRGRLTDLGDGIWEADANESFVAIHQDGDHELLLFYDVTDLEPLEGIEGQFFGTVGVVLACVLLITALGFALWLDRVVLRPLRELADATSTWGLEHWQTRRLLAVDRRDEIGQLARTSRRAATRIHRSLEWERNFTRNASHELRSPLTVIRGALDILRARPSDPRIERPLARIERAWQRMTSTIETFLWLAREEADVPEVPAEVDVVVDDCLAHLPRRPDRSVDVQRLVEPGLRLPISAPALRIVLDNLLGNALRHGADGTVVLSIDATRLEVTNPTLVPIENASKLPAPFVGDGSGIGLAIVEDLCDRYGWTLKLEPGDGSLTVRVLFELVGSKKR